jgi:hypothetical protein
MDILKKRADARMDARLVADARRVSNRKDLTTPDSAAAAAAFFASSA